MTRQSSPQKSEERFTCLTALSGRALLAGASGMSLAIWLMIMAII